MKSVMKMSKELKVFTFIRPRFHGLLGLASLVKLGWNIGPALYIIIYLMRKFYSKGNSDHD